MSKQIAPVNIWVNGESKIGEYFSVTCINDNYENSATNYWQIYTKVIDEEGLEKVGEQIAQGNLSIFGADYTAWGDQPAMAINAWIYDWSATKLALTII